MTAPQKRDNGAIEIQPVLQGRVRARLIGSTPIILHRMSEKALHELLLPQGKKTAAAKAANLKHDPMREFAAAPYMDEDPSAPTLIQHLSSSFKNALRSAALDLPGANKSQIGRLTWVNGERVSIYGVPEILMSVTRSSDINRTPDVRTRCVIPEWACEISVSFVQPILRDTAVVNLLSAAGVIQGIGDWRPGKGSGTYGQFELVDPDDERYAHIVATGGRDAQIAAMQEPAAYDLETRELLSWFDVEVKRRGFRVVG